MAPTASIPTASIPTTPTPIPTASIPTAPIPTTPIPLPIPVLDIDCCISCILLYRETTGYETALSFLRREGRRKGGRKTYS